ncbi:MAG: hypothetical protein HY897_24530 [Deltaproteobacteria bacterium]|nr:hypothetical protein [Deltaproteobacteria bacterium]
MATELSMLEQIVAFASGFVIKPAYMIAMLVFVLIVGRNSEPDVRQLGAGTAVFLLGEVFCAADYLFAGGKNVALEWLHGLGMIAGSGILFLGFINTADRRVLFFSAPGRACALTRFCGTCAKNTRTPCRFEHLFMFFSLSLAVVSCMPFASPFIQIDRTVKVFGTDVCQNHPVFLQLFEMRIYPATAVVLFCASFLALLWIRNSPVGVAKYPFAFGLGFFSYGTFKYFLLAAYREAVVRADFWEEVTELLLTAGLIIFVALFRKRLLLKGSHETGEAA